jgi:hypothetical protein
MAQKKFIIDGGFNTNADSTITGNLDITGDITMTGHIIPTVDSDGVTGYDLGTPNMKWRDLYLSKGSLYIDGQKVLESDSGTIVVQADPGQSMTVKTTGTGVLTLSSEQTVNFAATMQMAAGKKITTADGNAVVFGDKVDMDNNQLINLGAPTADGHAVTKLYVDQLVGNISTDAITEGDSEIEIADLGTGTVGFTIDGMQRFAINSTAASFTVPVTVNGATLASESYADAAANDAQTAAETYTDTAVANLIDSAPGALDTLNELAAALGDDANFASTVTNSVATAQATAIATAESYTDAREVSITNAYNTAISVESTAIANAYATAIATATVNITNAYEAYADAAEAAAITAAATDATSKADAAEAAAVSTAAADATSKADAAQSAAVTAAAADATAKADAAESAAVTAAAADATAKANAAESAAITAAAADATAKANAAESAAVTAAAADATSKANAAESAAVTAAAADATSKANAALSSAQSYADTAEADAVATASADATAKVSAEATARATAIANATSTASADATAKADAAEAAAVATASADATAKANAAEAAANTYTDTKVSALVDAAPSTLDTLNELAAALGDDPNFATTVTNSIAAKLSSSDLTRFHSAPVDVTDSTDLTYTFADLSSAIHYNVYLNRMLVRPNEFTVSGTTVTFSANVLATGDEIEVSGFKV